MSFWESFYWYRKVSKVLSLFLLLFVYLSLSNLFSLIFSLFLFLSLSLFNFIIHRTNKKMRRKIRGKKLINLRPILRRILSFVWTLFPRLLNIRLSSLNYINSLKTFLLDKFRWNLYEFPMVININKTANLVMCFWVEIFFFNFG